MTNEEAASINTAYEEVANNLDSIFEKIQSKWERLITSFNTKISEQNEILTRESDRQSKGLANNYTVEEAKLKELQKVRDEAIKKQEKNQIIQLRLNQGEQLSNVALAVSKIFSKESEKGTIGVIAAGISVVSMLASIAATNSKIQALKKYEKGGEIEGESHANGGVALVRNGQAFAEAEGGEFITNKRAYSNSHVITNMINNHQLTDKDLPFLSAKRNMRIIGMSDNTSALHKLTDSINNGKPISHGVYMYTVKNNYVIKKRK